jgi:anti-sigma factor RsiW
MKWWRRRRRGIACQELVELVSDYLEGVLEPAERARIQAHLAECDDCTVYVEQFEETVRALRSLPGDEPEPAEREALLSVFRGWAAQREAGPPQSGA